MKIKFAVLVVVAAVHVVELRAQQAGGSSGMFGSRSMGSSFSPGASTFAGSGGAAGVGGQGTVAGLTTRGDTTAGTVTGNERFVRGARQPGQFVGADSADSTAFMSQVAALSALSSQAAMNRNSAGTNANRNLGGADGNSRTVMPRIQTVVGFEYRKPVAADISSSLEARFARTSHLSPGRIQVTMEGRTAILRGVVATPRDRVVAEQATLLEAGVDAVRNELQLAGADIPPPGSQNSTPAAPTLPATPANTAPGN